MKPARMAGLVLLALTAACSQATEPFVIPELKDVDYVKVSRFKGGTEKVWEHEIRDPRRIAPILAHFQEHNRGYRTATSTFLRKLVSERGDQDHAISFGGYDGVPLVIWIGPDWLGGFDMLEGGAVDRDRALSADEREALLALIREPDPMGRVIVANGRDI